MMPHLTKWDWVVVALFALLIALGVWRVTVVAGQYRAPPPKAYQPLDRTHAE